MEEIIRRKPMNSVRNRERCMNSSGNPLSNRRACTDRFREAAEKRLTNPLPKVMNATMITRTLLVFMVYDQLCNII
jgi:hypothetical protein